MDWLQDPCILPKVWVLCLCVTYLSTGVHQLELVYIELLHECHLLCFHDTTASPTRCIWGSVQDSSYEAYCSSTVTSDPQDTWLPREYVQTGVQCRAELESAWEENQCLQTEKARLQHSERGGLERQSTRRSRDTTWWPSGRMPKN